MKGSLALITLYRSQSRASHDRLGLYSDIFSAAAVNRSVFEQRCKETGNITAAQNDSCAPRSRLSYRQLVIMRRAVLRASRRLSDALPSAAGGVGVSPAVRDQTQFEQLRAEAFARRARPDMAALVKCGSLHEAVAEVVSAKMSRSASDTRLPRGALRQLLWDALRGDERVGADVAAIIKRDPASTTHLQTVAYLKGFHAVQAQRAAHRFWRAGGFENDHVAFAIQDRVNELWSLCIHPGAQIGGGCFIDHATSVVIGETATIGRDCTILHGVTLGGTGKARTKRHPSIGDRVTLGVGATSPTGVRRLRPPSPVCHRHDSPLNSHAGSSATLE